MKRELLLGLMYEQTNEQALILLDEQGLVVDWLMGSARIFGHERAAMVGRSIHCLFTPEDQERQVPESELDSACRAGAGEDDRWMVRSDSGRFWASGVVQALRDGAGRVVGFAKLLRDRTDLRGQVEALRNRAEALDAEDRRKLTMLGTLAHELRNPLSAMSNAAMLIDLIYPNDGKIAQPLQVFKRQTSYLSSLVGDLFEIARVRGGKAKLQIESIELATIIDAALESADAELRKRQQRVGVLLPAAPIRLEADATRLKQVLINLVINASKFSAPSSPIWIKGTIEGDEAVVRVEDRGRGISPVALPHIFDLLSQADGVDIERREGLGLGLSIVKEYVELHGGSVQVRSEGVQQGSEFTVRLPLAPRIPPLATAAGAAQIVAANALRVP